jgi:hypothetical protein
MGVEHLEGKRTGRPKGSKSRPWIRALRWACRNLDRPNAVPPSPLAEHYLALGRERPDQFLACLAALDKKAAPTQPETGFRAPCTDRLMVLFWPLRHLTHRLTHYKGATIVNLPRDFRVLDSRVDPARDGILFLIWSGSFPQILSGAPVPAFAPRWEGLMWTTRG